MPIIVKYLWMSGFHGKKILPYPFQYLGALWAFPSNSNNQQGRVKYIHTHWLKLSGIWCSDDKEIQKGKLLSFTQEAVWNFHSNFLLQFWWINWCKTGFWARIYFTFYIWKKMICFNHLKETFKKYRFVVIIWNKLRDLYNNNFCCRWCPISSGQKIIKLCIKI